MNPLSREHTVIADSRNDVCSSGSTSSMAPAWMGRVLLLAGIYNLAWGAFAILFPMTLFRLTGFDPLPLYPEFWQCIGMIVGVYGIGYAIASRDPFRHWPIVLVGLLGKIAGPVGFASAVYSGRLPVALGWTILTNDLVWWAPFALILWRAAQVHQATYHLISVTPPPRPIDPMGRMISQLGATMSELSRRSPVLVVFLRHSGCTFCRQALSDLASQRQQIEANGTKIALVHMGHEEPKELLDRYNLTDLHCFRDPVCALYEAFGLEMGGFRQLFGLTVWIRGVSAWFAGHGIGGLNGNGFRMPGSFLIHRGEILRAFRHSTAADRPDYAELATLPTADTDRPRTSESRSQPLVS